MRHKIEPAHLLLADPPWKFGDNLPGAKRGAARNYHTLTPEQIGDFPLPPLAESCILLLWRVAAMQEEALMVARRWGFVIKSEIVWVKAAGPMLTRLHFGMGRYVRNAHETCLIGTRGSALKLVTDHSTRSVFFAERPLAHSAKPLGFYSLVERLFAGPRVELFARNRRPGWTQYGDQLGPA